MKRFIFFLVMWMFASTLNSNADTMAPGLFREDLKTDTAPPKIPYNKYAPREQRDLISDLTPGYRIKQRISLVQISNTKRKESIMFVLPMNKEKMEKQPSDVHILWTGSRKIVDEQKVLEDKYPVDVSISNYDDGYARGEWNVVLPNKKPHEVAVALAWSF